MEKGSKNMSQALYIYLIMTAKIGNNRMRNKKSLHRLLLESHTNESLAWLELLLCISGYISIGHVSVFLHPALIKLQITV